MKYGLLMLLFFLATKAFSQSYTSYLTGDSADVNGNASGGLCLMGGAIENDSAMKWFLRRSDGGDVLVLRASGSDGYNNYMFDSLGLTLNSVETIVFNDASASKNSYVLSRIREAEAIWLAGGNQLDYVNYWRGTPVDSLVNEGIRNRDLVIGGTSAGMAVLGGFYFSAGNGTVSSGKALNNPYHPRVTVEQEAFFEVPYMGGVITDTHYDNPDRKGRHVTFMARIFQDWDLAAKGIACDEFTAVCIDTNGIASIYGNYPEFDDNAYFLQPNCELATMKPENCTADAPLNWNRNAQALKVYKAKGTPQGQNTFDLSDWETGNGGTWQHWYVDQGTLQVEEGTSIDCDQSTSITEKADLPKIKVFPNPVKCGGSVHIRSSIDKPLNLELVNLQGKTVQRFNGMENQVEIHPNLEEGIYWLRLQTPNKMLTRQLLVR